MSTEVVILLLILGVSIVYAIFTITTTPMPTSIVTYDQIRSSLKTGDLILFSKKLHPNLVEKIAYTARTKLLSNAYGHIGIVYKPEYLANDKIYFIEVVSPNQTAANHAFYFGPEKLGGLRIIDLDTLIAIYAETNNATFTLIPINQAIDSKLFEEAVESFGMPAFESGLALTTLAFVDTVISHKLAVWLATKYKSQKMMCSEFVYELLVRCGIIPELEPQFDGKLFWPHFFTNGVFSRLASRTYGTSIEFRW